MKKIPLSKVKQTLPELIKHNEQIIITDDDNPDKIVATLIPESYKNVALTDDIPSPEHTKFIKQHEDKAKQYLIKRKQDTESWTNIKITKTIKVTEDPYKGDIVFHFKVTYNLNNINIPITKEISVGYQAENHKYYIMTTSPILA